MELVLEVISYKGLPSVDGASVRFNEQGGSIGRSEKNHLALPDDEEKLVSRRHADIRFEAGRFALEDVSTGGTWLCGEQRWLSHDSAPLADGDQIKIGEYELRVRVEAQAREAFAGFFDRPPGPSAAPYGSKPGAASFAPLDDDALPLPLPLGPSPAGPQASPSFIGQPDAPPCQESFAPPGIQPAPAPPGLEGGFSIENFFQEGLQSPPAAPPAKDDEFNLDKYLSGGLGLQEQPLAAPPLADEAAARPVPPELPAEKPAPAVDINIPRPGRPLPPPPAPSSESEPTSLLPPRQPQPMAAPPAAVEAGELFRCFLEGAGLAGLPAMTPEEQRRAMKAVGTAYREMVDGLLQVLLARKMEKSMIPLRRSDVTQFRRGEYNPLKVFPTAEETMKEMVCRQNPAYLEPSEAIKEGFADIMNHQMAMRAGMQAALDGFLKRMAPQAFEELYKEGIVFQKKAKCWEAYCQAYPKFVQEAMDDLFGEAFAAAYREQLRALRDSQR